MPDPLNEAHCCVTSMGTDPNAHDPDCEVGTPAYLSQHVTTPTVVTSLQGGQ